MSQTIKEEMDEMVKKITESLNKAVEELDNPVLLPKGRYICDDIVPEKRDKVYSSLIGRYVDAKTGEVIYD